jgi:hypothetical protein
MGRKIARVSKWLIAAAIAVALLLAAAIHLDAYALRWRGERLQSDIRSLELRKSTYADARRLEHRWWDESEEGVCRPSWCDLQILLRNAGARHTQFLVNHPAILAIYHSFGGRIAGVYSFVRVRDGLVWGKGISMGIDTLVTEPDGRHVQYELIGATGTDDHFIWVSARHPEYEIGGPTACESCREGWVKFTAFADPQDVLRLTDLNFSCLARWHFFCTEQADILPTAWKELLAEAAQPAQNGPDSCTLAMIRVLSRQTRHVDLVKVIKLDLKEPVPTMTVRRLSRVPFQLENWWPEFSLVVDPSDNVHLGDKLLHLGDRCQTVPATAENIEAARLGAGEGWISPAHPLSLPIGAFKRPNIDIR